MGIVAVVMAEPRHGRVLAEVTAALSACRLVLSNVRTAGHHPADARHARLHAYQRAVTEQLGVLRHLLTQASIDRLLTGRRHDFLQAVDPWVSNGVDALVCLELEEIDDRLAEAVAEHERFAGRWSAHRAAEFVVPDTNVLLHHPRAWIDISWDEMARPQAARVDLVVPLVVLDELDDAKNKARGRGKGSSVATPGLRARDALRDVERLFDDVPDRAAPISRAVAAHLLLDEPGHVRHPRADDELVAQARWLHDLSGRVVTLATYDTGCAVRARAAGLRTYRPDTDGS